MRKYLLIILLLLAQVLLPGMLPAQTRLPDYHPALLPNPLVGIGVNARVSQSSEGYFIYNYEIYNPRANNGRITNVYLGIPRGVGDATMKSDGLKTECYIPKDIMAAVTPVGMEKPPHWDCGVGTHQMAGWSSSDHPYDIVPGQSLSGMVLTSYGLPGIRNVKVLPLIVETVYPSIEEYDVDMDELRKVQDQDEERVSFYGRTIGPTAPPAVFKTVEFLDYIIDLKHQAASLGWIDNAGIVTSLDVKLDNAKKKLSQGDNNTARNILGAFINEVEAQAGKHLTSEAYALLKYNAAYIMSNLPK